MPEDQLPIRGAQFRGSRYPGFVSPNVTPLAADPTTDAGALTDQPQDFGPLADAPDPMKELGKSVAGSAATYATTKIGQGAGEAIAGGAGVGEAAKAGVTKLSDSVKGLFDFSGNAAGGAAGGATSGAAGGLTSFGGDVVGNAAQEAVGAVGGQAAGSAGGGAAGAAAGDAAAGTAASTGASSLGTESFGSRLTSGANIGGAVGAGLGTAAVGLLTGQKPVEAAKSGVGAAAGFYVGNAILPGVGGFIGGAIGGSVFCFAAGTLILMSDGSTKRVENLELGDIAYIGGEVLGVGKAFTDELMMYKDVIVSPSHAVFEDGVWMRVKESKHAKPLEIASRDIIYPIVTATHVVLTPTFVASDMVEIEDTWNYTEEQRIIILNTDYAARNMLLVDFESLVSRWRFLTQHAA